jgi:uncharacterized Zn finger protein (UPF0148 family)
MFDKLLQQLKQLEKGVKVPVNLPLDEEGYLDRQCPAKFCHAEFKVLWQDWKGKVKDEKVFCPICGVSACATEWNSEEQEAHLKQVALAYVQKTVRLGLSEDAQRFNRSQRPGFIQMRLSIRPAPPLVIIPIDAAKAMRQNFTCEVCGCRYASIGAAFFCPACGHNSAIVMFDQTIGTVRQIMSTVDVTRNSLSKEYDEDIAENSIRHMVENNLGRLVGAFQQFTEALFNKLPSAVSLKYRKNAFQNLLESSDLWRRSTGKDYENFLSPDELQELEILFQKRHLLVHRNGIVDQEYIDKSGDKSYEIGQRIVIRKSEVLRLAELLSELASELRKDIIVPATFF